MRRCSSLLFCLLFLTLAAGASSAPPFGDKIDDLLDRSRVADAFWGVAVYDLEADEMVYQHNVDHTFLPASNQKLITSAAALHFHGSTHRFETSLHFEGTTDQAVMKGDLIIDGSGDPTFGSTEVQGKDPLKAWARRLASMGVERIEGRLVGNDDAFSGRPYPEGWNINYITRQKGRHMGVSAGGLSYRDNVVPVRVRASQPGQPPRVTVQPSGVVDVTNNASTSSRWRGSSLQIHRTFSTNELVLEGSVPRSYQSSLAVPVSDPTAFVLRSFAFQLEQAGIETDLTLVDVDEMEGDPSLGSPLFTHFSRPLSEIAAVLNKKSNNFYAEQVFRSYGWGGSARGAARRTESFLRRAGVTPRRMLIHDGSGLSRKNLVTPTAMVQLLAHMDDHEARDAFLSSLPEGGERNTTLERRLYRTPVQAKTGSLEFVRALSGYATRPNGNRVAFAVFANNYTGPSYLISNTIDDIVRTLAGA